jgi:hypothetical protein
MLLSLQVIRVISEYADNTIVRKPVGRRHFDHSYALQNITPIFKVQVFGTNE